MLINILRRNSFAAFIFCLLVLFLFWLPKLFFGLESGTPENLANTIPQPLWLECFQNKDCAIWLAFALTAIATYFLLLLGDRFLDYSLNEFALPLLYVVVVSAFPATQWFSGVQLAVLLLIIGLRYLFLVRQKHLGLGELFIAVFCFSCAAFCFPPALLILVLPIVLFITNISGWRAWIIFIVAATLPFAYLLLYYWVSANDITPALDNLCLLLPDFHIALPTTTIPQLVFIVIVFFGIIFAFSHGFLQRMGTKAQHAYVHLIIALLLLFSVLGIFFYPTYSYQLLPLIALPVSVMLAYYFLTPSRGRKKKLIYLYVLIAAVVYLQVVEFL